MKIAKAYKKAAKREAMVRSAKWKNPEELTREEAIEVVKWDAESRRNTSILLTVIGLAGSAIAHKALKEEIKRTQSKI